MSKDYRLYKKEFQKRKKKLIKFIKKDYDEFNGEKSFLFLNQLLLENYLEYYTKRHNVYQADDSLNETISELSECLLLINKLIDDDYENDAYLYFKQHTNSSDDIFNHTWDSKDSYKEYINLINKAESCRKKDYEKTFKLIGKYCRNWWD